MGTNKIGYIVRCGDKETGYRFKFYESSYTRRISPRGDKIYSKILYPQDYDVVMDNTKIMKEGGILGNRIILITEPFFIDDELKERVIKWIEWANSVDQSEYDPFYRSGVNNNGNK